MTITTTILLIVISIISYNVGMVKAIHKIATTLASKDKKHSKGKEKFQKLIESFEQRNKDLNEIR